MMKSVSNFALAVSIACLATGCGKESSTTSFPTPEPAPAPVVDSSTTGSQPARTDGIRCPDQPQQLSRDILIDAKGQIGALGALSGASLEGKVSAISNNLMSKYPNADRLYLSQMMMSTYCETLKSTTSLTDVQKLDRINALNAQVMQLFTAPAPKPDVRSRAKETDFPEPYRAVWQQIRVTKDKQPTLHIFDPQCDVYVYISEIIHGEDSARLNMQNFRHAIIAKKFEEFSYTFKTDDDLFQKALQTTRMKSDDHEANLKKDYESGRFDAMLVLQIKTEACRAHYHVEYT